MRPPQNKRMRGRNNNNNNNNHRRNSNSLTRSYESNGPDIKVRGTASHIAEKYVQLARDAHVAGDPVAAESYLQHAEHYFRLIASIHAAQNPPPRQADGSLVDQSTNDDGDDDDFDGGINDRFTYRAPQAYQQPAGQAPQAFAGGEQANGGVEAAEQPVVDLPYGEARPDGNRNQNQNRYDNRPDSRPDNRADNRPGNRFDNRRDNRGNRDFQRPDGNRIDGNRDNNRQDGNRQDGNRFDPRRDRNQRNDRPDYRAERSEGNPRYENGRQDQQREPMKAEPVVRADLPWQQEQPRVEPVRLDRPPRAPEIASVQPILPSFITAPVRAVPIIDGESGERPVSAVQNQDEPPAPRKRGRRKIVAANEDAGPAVETPAAE